MSRPNRPAATSSRLASPALPPLHFRSAAHPQGASAALVYARALVAPLAACTLPVMLGALAAALQGLSVMPFLTAGFPAALLAAWLWARFQLYRTLAEVHVRPCANTYAAAAVRTVPECLGAAPRPLVWQRVHDLRAGRAALGLALGRESYTLRQAEWPDFDALREALRQARHHDHVTPL